MTSNLDNENGLEAEAALSGYAARIARGHGPREFAEGLVELFNSTDPDRRWKRLALARLFAGMFERVGASDHPDAERCRNLAAKLREIEAANK